MIEGETKEAKYDKEKTTQWLKHTGLQLPRFKTKMGCYILVI